MEIFHIKCDYPEQKLNKWIPFKVKTLECMNAVHQYESESVLHCIESCHKFWMWTSFENHTIMHGMFQGAFERFHTSYL